MKTYLDCIPCYFRQALAQGRIAGCDDAALRAIVNEVARMIPDWPLDHPPAELSSWMYRGLRQWTGDDDHYRALKHENIREALALLPEMRGFIAAAADPLLAAVRVAIAGNVIDFGVHTEFDIARDARTILTQEFAIDDYAAFRAAAARARTVLYIGDNAGESVFDRPLIEALGVPVTYAVRSAPVLNDQIVDDALASGLGEVSTIIPSGSTAPATILDQCTPEFLVLFSSADLVISKGQGNYEGLSGAQRPVFFLLKAKCGVIARDLGVEEGAIVVKGI